MKNICIASLGIAFALYSCDKTENYTPSTLTSVDDFTELIVPSDFAFATTKVIDLSLLINDNQGFNNSYRIEVYDFPPSAEGSLIYSGYTDSNLNAKFEVPTFTKELYIVKEDPNGSSSMSIVDVVGNSVSHTFGKKKSKGKATSVVSPDCNTGCDLSYNNHTGNISVNNNSPASTICITGSYSGQITINKASAVLKICGNATVTTLSLNSGSSLILTDGASLNVNTLRLNSSAGEITVYNASLTVNTTFSISGKVTNYGTINVNQGSSKFNITTSNSEFINNGSLNVSGDAQSSNDLTNSGSMNITGDLQFNTNSITTNNCFITVGADLAISDVFDNYSLVDVTGDLSIGSNSSVTCYDGAMMVVDNAVLNGGITGSGTTSLVKVSGNTTINGSGSLNGNLEYCDANGIETNTGSINTPATLACNVYIPTSSCNTAGNGTPTVVDSDNDGVADDNDLFPNDPDRAGESYYPGSNQYGTLAFEDLWPGKGDYDFNDVIVDFRYRMITDANNDVKDIEIDYALRAIGGSLQNGFGIEFDVAPSSIASVTGTQYFENSISLNANGTEASQSKAVVIIFDNAFGVLPNNGTQTVNTNPGEATSAVDTNNVSITFTSTVSQSQVAFSSFNPFIYIGQDRGKELHPADKTPTDLANATFFGTGDDDSDPSSDRYYVTENNLPWVLEMAVSFDYPVEKEDIVQAYSYFSTWAQSGGNSLTDWYLDLPGYRDVSKVYN